MRTALETVRAASEETARAAEGSRAMNHGGTANFPSRSSAPSPRFREQVRRGSDLGREAVPRANASRDIIDALAKAADHIGDIVGGHQCDRRADQSAGAQRHDRGGARRRSRPRLCGGRLGGQVAGDADRQSTEQIGAKVAEIQSTTREVVASLASVAEAIDQLSGVTDSVSAAIEQQRAATEDFALSARETNAAVSDVAGRMADIADMVHSSRASAQDVAAVAAGDAGDLAGSVRGNPRYRAQGGQGRFARIPALRRGADRAAGVPAAAAVEVAVMDISEGGARIARGRASRDRRSRSR